MKPWPDKNKGTCGAGHLNLGQFTCLDTSLNERWIRYVCPHPGYCIRSLSIFQPDQRSGAHVTGFQTNSATPNDRSLWPPFIYHIDSSTKKSIKRKKLP
jgi:hypothetical protein